MATTGELTFGRHLFSRQPWQLNWFQRSNEPRDFKKYWIIMTQIPSGSLHTVAAVSTTKREPRKLVYRFPV